MNEFAWAWSDTTADTTSGVRWCSAMHTTGGDNQDTAGYSTDGFARNGRDP